MAAADFDRDGDLDLFVGGRAVPGQYPVAPSSRLLINSGGTFQPASPEVIPGTDRLGMVTGALWSDPDNDGWQDLLLTVEWGPVRLFKNAGGKLVDQTAAAGLGERLGWWNGIAGGDIDGDGDIDYLVTNNGLNSKYKATAERPALIYYGDFDDTGTAHIVEAKYDPSGKILPRRGFSCSKNAMPFLEDKLKTFHNFAISGLADLYTDTKLARSLRLEANSLESGLLVNDGEGAFSWRPLPRIAQIAPSFGAVLEDLDADGDLDAALAQNSFSPQRETGHMDGGLGQVLRNDGEGPLHPITPKDSGIEIPRDGKSLAVTDLDADGRPDLVFGLNNDPVVSYLGQSAKQPLAVRLVGKNGNPSAVGARVTIDGQVREQSTGGGYSSPSGSLLYFGPPDADSSAQVRWPDGTVSEHPIKPDVRQITLTQP